MSEASIPAWKRLGLQQNKKTPKQSEAAYDPLKEGLKRAHEAGETPKSIKPAKRAKVPKAERSAPTHELDQLAYLRQFSEDRSNWKFSKQKQNWILKHMFTEINDDRYNEPLLAYIEGLMGHARNWAAEDAKELVNRWNVFMKESIDEKKDENEAPEKPVETKNEEPQKDTSAEETDKDASGEGNGKKKQKKQKTAQPAKEERKVPSEKMARRAQEIVKRLTGETLSLEFLDASSP